MNSGQEIPSELVVSGGDAPEVLEPAEAALDDVSAFVGTFVEAMDDDPVGFIGDYGLGPAIEAIVDGRVRAVFTRTIAPSRTRLQHVNDAADDAPIVVPFRPRQSRRQMRFDTRPLSIIQPKQPLAHSLAPESTPRPE